MNQKRILIFYIIICLFLLSGCKKKNVEENPKTAISISVKSENDTVTLDLDEFLLNDLKVIVKYNDESEDEIPVTKDMLNQADFEKLFTTGDHYVTIKYVNLETVVLVNITSTKGTQNRVPMITIYNLIESNNSQTKNVFYTTGSGNYISFQLQYQYDTTLITDISITKADNLTGSFVSNVQDGLITISYTSFTRITGNTQVFTVDFKTDKEDRYFKLTDFDNAFYDYNETKTNVFKLLGTIGSYNR